MKVYVQSDWWHTQTLSQLSTVGWMSVMIACIILYVALLPRGVWKGLGGGTQLYRKGHSFRIQIGWFVSVLRKSAHLSQKTYVFNNSASPPALNLLHMVNGKSKVPFIPNTIISQDRRVVLINICIFCCPLLWSGFSRCLSSSVMLVKSRCSGSRLKGLMSSEREVRWDYLFFQTILGHVSHLKSAY